MIVQSHLFRREPGWFDDQPVLSQRIPIALRSWLYEPGSLTLRLQQGCRQRFRVELIEQGWAQPFAGEAALLGHAGTGRCLVREVALLDGDLPLVLARSIIPAATLRAADPGLGRLGTRPLGEVLFACPKLRRRLLQLAQVSPQDLRLAVAAPLWGRRSLYSIAAGDLLVCEFFLPAALGLREVNDA